MTASPAAPVESRRTLRYESLHDILRDAESFDGATVSAAGGWTPAQIVQHVAKTIRLSIDGTEYRAPLVIRLLARLLKKRTLVSPMKPGFRMPKALQPLFMPDDDVTWEQAIAELRAEVERVERGAAMAQPSPAFGPMSPEEWEHLHCRHAEMHFSFLRAGDADAA